MDVLDFFRVNKLNETENAAVLLVIDSVLHNVFVVLLFLT